MQFLKEMSFYGMKIDFQMIFNVIGSSFQMLGVATGKALTRFIIILGTESCCQCYEVSDLI